MRKEIVLAIIAGGVLGLVIAYGAWQANLSLTSGKTSTPAPTAISSGIPTSKIAIAKPLNQEVINLSPTIVSGIAQGNSTLIISSDDKDYVNEASSSGAFEEEVDLTGGLNQIKIFSFDKSGNTSQAQILLVFSTEFGRNKEKPTASATATPTSTSSGNTILEKVQEKIQKVANTSLAYIGTITDITDTTLQIKNEEGQIQQVSPEKEITYLKTTQTTTKEIKFTDLAIGDFIVAMGTKNGNSVLHTSRLLVTNPFKDNDLKTFFGNVTSNQANQLTLKNPKTEEEISLTPQKNLKITKDKNIKSQIAKVSNIEKGTLLIAIGKTNNKAVLEIRHLHILQLP